MMKTFTKILFGVRLTIIIFSCKNLSEEHSTINFTRGDFKRNVTLSNPEEIFLDTGEEITDPLAYYLIRDTCLIVENQTNNSSFADLYSLNNKKILTHLDPRGRGPGEFLAFRPIIFSNDNKNFYATDGRLFYIIDTDLTLKNHKLEILNSFNYTNEDTHPNTDICLIDSQTYAAYNL